METIPKSDCRRVGFVRKTHGVHGEIALEFEPQFELAVEDAQCFFIDLEGLLVPFFVSADGIRFKSEKTALITFDWVETEDNARRLVGKEVYLFKNEIIDDDDNNADSSFLNYMLKDKKRGEIGRISEIDDYSGNIVLTVSNENRQILIPFNNDFVVSTDKKNKILVLDLPEGLIED